MKGLKRSQALKSLLAIVLALLLACCVSADIVSDVCRYGTVSPSYDQVLQNLRALQSPRVTLTSIGATHGGRPIPLVVVRDPSVPLDQTVRVFIIARQHGTEASGTVACLALARHFAAATGELEQELLRQLTLIMVPVANPDGMCASRRANGGHLDLNRQWGDNGQPEIKAIKAAVQRYQPHALIDMHELPASSSKPAFRDNFIQTIGRDNRLAADLTTDCSATSARLASWMGQCGLPVSIYYDTSSENLKLCHRYFGLACRIPSYLFEAKCGSTRPLAARVRFQVLGTLVVANYALHRYYCPEREAPDAADLSTMADAGAQGHSPDTPAEPPAGPPTVTLTRPQPNEVARGQLPITATVTDLPPGAYLSFSVDGRIRSLTNAAPHQYFLDTLTCKDGEHEVVVELCDALGRTLGTARSVIMVDNRPAAGE